MNLMLSLFIVILVSVLSIPVANKDLPRIDPEVQEFVDQFMHDCQLRRKDCYQKLSRVREIKVIEMVTFAEEEPGETIGRCYYGTLSSTIHLSKDAMRYADRYIKALVYHELGHCMYDLDHVERPGAVMSPYLPPLLYLVFQWDALLDEFFEQIRQKNGD